MGSDPGGQAVQTHRIRQIACVPRTTGAAVERHVSWARSACTIPPTVISTVISIDWRICVTESACAARKRPRRPREVL